jgi:hypothetical protein
VLNRPYAFLQWLQQVKLKEKYVLMSEPDHVFLRPLQNLMVGENPAAFPFFYIEPSRKDYVHITQKFIGADKTRRDCEKIAPIGSSPTFLRVDDLAKIAGPWVNNSIAIFQDPESNKVRSTTSNMKHASLHSQRMSLALLQYTFNSLVPFINSLHHVCCLNSEHHLSRGAACNLVSALEIGLASTGLHCAVEKYSGTLVSRPSF